MTGTGARALLRSATARDRTSSCGTRSAEVYALHRQQELLDLVAALMGADEDGRHPVSRAATGALRGRLERANPAPFSVRQGSVPARRSGGGMGFDGDRGVSRRASPGSVAFR